MQSQSPTPIVKADRTSPEMSVRSFVALFSRGDVILAAKCVLGTTDNKVYAQLQMAMHRNAPLSISVQHCSTEIHGATATFAKLVAQTKPHALKYDPTGAVFHCPMDHSGSESYAFNSRLQDAPLGMLQNPAKTVLFYEGKQETLNFRHGGRAVVSFVDGHTKFMTPEEAQSLRWKP